MQVNLSVAPESDGMFYEWHFQESQTCVAFNSTSRYIVTGGQDGHVHVWDLKAQPFKLKRSYKVR